MPFPHYVLEIRCPAHFFFRAQQKEIPRKALCPRCDRECAVSVIGTALREVEWEYCPWQTALVVNTQYERETGVKLRATVENAELKKRTAATPSAPPARSTSRPKRGRKPKSLRPSS